MSYDELSQNLPDSSHRSSDLAIDRPYPAGHIIESADEGSGIGHLLADDEGFVVGRIENEMLRLKTDAHLVTVAPTGAGKGRGVVILTC